MTNFNGFWSYVHADDDAEGGRIVELAHDVVSQFELITGETVELFLDRDRLEWGDDWQPKVDSNLASVAFFIPIITTRFFASTECRRELDFFAKNAEKLGVNELVLPILYQDFPDLRNEDIEDDLIRTVRRFQWEDWTDLKFEDRTSGAYRRAVSRLAERLVAANARAAAAEPTVSSERLDVEDESDLPGTIDTLGSMEDALPSMTNALTGIGEAVVEIGAMMQSSTAEMNTGPVAPSASQRVLVARKLAQELQAPVQKVVEQGNRFSADLRSVDEGVRILITQSPDEIRRQPEAREQFFTFFNTVRSMVTQSEAGFASMTQMIEAMAPIEKLSRDLRPPLRSLRHGLTLVIDGLSVMRSWIPLLDTAEEKIESAA
jgi:hypothetical protein